MKFELSQSEDRKRPIVRLHFSDHEAYSSLHRLLVAWKVQGLGTTGTESGWTVFFPLTSWTHVDDFMALMRELDVKPYEEASE